MLVYNNFEHVSFLRYGLQKCFFCILLQQMRIKSKVIRLDLDCTAAESPDWCEIDAIKVHGKTTNIGRSMCPLSSHQLDK